MITIRLIPEDELEQILPLLQSINTEVPLSELENRLQNMKQYGYQCLGVYYDNKLIGISGLWLLYKHYIGKHIEPDNVVILPEYRNKGIGEQLMTWIYNYAKEQNCTTVELNAYVENEGAHKFWKNQGFKIVGYHFQKKLN